MNFRLQERRKKKKVKKDKEDSISTAIRLKTHPKCNVRKRSPGTRITSNEVTKLSQDVASNLYHVLMTSWSLQSLWKLKKKK